MTESPREAARHYLRKGDHARAELNELLDLVVVEAEADDLDRAEYFRSSARVAWYLLKLLTYSAPEDVIDAVEEYRANGRQP